MTTFADRFYANQNAAIASGREDKKALGHFEDVHRDAAHLDHPARRIELLRAAALKLARKDQRKASKQCGKEIWGAIIWASVLDGGEYPLLQEEQAVNEQDELQADELASDERVDAAKEDILGPLVQYVDSSDDEMDEKTITTSGKPKTTNLNRHANNASALKMPPFATLASWDLIPTRVPPKLRCGGCVKRGLVCEYGRAKSGLGGVVGGLGGGGADDSDSESDEEHDGGTNACRRCVLLAEEDACNRPWIEREEPTSPLTLVYPDSPLREGPSFSVPLGVVEATHAGSNSTWRETTPGPLRETTPALWRTEAGLGTGSRHTPGPLNWQTPGSGPSNWQALGASTWPAGTGTPAKKKVRREIEIHVPKRLPTHVLGRTRTPTPAPEGRNVAPAVVIPSTVATKKGTLTTITATTKKPIFPVTTTAKKPVFPASTTKRPATEAKTPGPGNKAVPKTKLKGSWRTQSPTPDSGNDETEEEEEEDVQVLTMRGKRRASPEKETRRASKAPERQRLASPQKSAHGGNARGRGGGVTPRGRGRGRGRGGMGRGTGPVNRRDEDVELDGSDSKDEESVDEEQEVQGSEEETGEEDEDDEDESGTESDDPIILHSAKIVKGKGKGKVVSTPAKGKRASTSTPAPAKKSTLITPKTKGKTTLATPKTKGKSKSAPKTSKRKATSAPSDPQGDEEGDEDEVGEGESTLPPLAAEFAQLYLSVPTGAALAVELSIPLAACEGREGGDEVTYTVDEDGGHASFEFRPHVKALGPLVGVLQRMQEEEGDDGAGGVIWAQRWLRDKFMGYPPFPVPSISTAEVSRSTRTQKAKDAEARSHRGTGRVSPSPSYPAQALAYNTYTVLVRRMSGFVRKSMHVPWAEWDLVGVPVKDRGCTRCKTLDGGCTWGATGVKGAGCRRCLLDRVEGECDLESEIEDRREEPEEEVEEGQMKHLHNTDKMIQKINTHIKYSIRRPTHPRSYEIRVILRALALADARPRDPLSQDSTHPSSPSLASIVISSEWTLHLGISIPDSIWARIAHVPKMKFPFGPWVQDFDLDPQGESECTACQKATNPGMLAVHGSHVRVAGCIPVGAQTGAFCRACFVSGAAECGGVMRREGWPGGDASPGGIGQGEGHVNQEEGGDAEESIEEDQHQSRKRHAPTQKGREKRRKVGSGSESHTQTPTPSRADDADEGGGEESETVYLQQDPLQTSTDAMVVDADTLPHTPTTMRQRTPSDAHHPGPSNMEVTEIDAPSSPAYHPTSPSLSPRSSPFHPPPYFISQARVLSSARENRGNVDQPQANLSIDIAGQCGLPYNTAFSYDPALPLPLLDPAQNQGIDMARGTPDSRRIARLEAELVRMRDVLESREGDISILRGREADVAHLQTSNDRLESRVSELETRLKGMETEKLQTVRALEIGNAELVNINAELQARMESQNNREEKLEARVREMESGWALVEAAVAARRYE